MWRNSFGHALTCDIYNDHVYIHDFCTNSSDRYFVGVDCKMNDLTGNNLFFHMSKNELI